MISSGFSGKPTLYGLLALSTMEIVASQEPGLPLAILQQPTRHWSAIMASSEVTQGPGAASPAIETAIAVAPTGEPGFAESSAIASQTPASSDSFRDLQSHWSQPFVELLAVRGIISGYSDGTFQPDREIQADHFGIMLHRAKLYRLKVLQRDLGIANSGAIAQSPNQLDAATAITTEAEAARLLQTHNIRTRAQAAVFIYRNMQAPLVGQAPVAGATEQRISPQPMASVQAFEPAFAEPVEDTAPLLSEGFQWSESVLIAQG